MLHKLAELRKEVVDSFWALFQHLPGGVDVSEKLLSRVTSYSTSDTSPEDKHTLIQTSYSKRYIRLYFDLPGDGHRTMDNRYGPRY
jgi:hypothetical protein